MPRENRKKFTRAMWDRWLAELNEEAPPHPHAEHLRAGIEETREILYRQTIGQAVARAVDEMRP